MDSMPNRGEQQRLRPEAAAKQACRALTQWVILDASANRWNTEKFMRIRVASCRIQILVLYKNTVFGLRSILDLKIQVRLHSFG